ncbi:hypothetical protein BGX38DRAFT_1189369 [Terfezia claveryi]|nr:hypothetical protein BGX38DRAFT_1189369 [Terfezia claveryi]
METKWIMEKTEMETKWDREIAKWDREKKDENHVGTRKRPRWKPKNAKALLIYKHKTLNFSSTSKMKKPPTSTVHKSLSTSGNLYTTTMNRDIGGWISRVSIPGQRLRTMMPSKSEPNLH